MMSLPIGFLMTLGVFIFSIGYTDMALYFNLHSALIVGGGTIAILLFSTPTQVLQNLKREVASLFKKQDRLDLVQADLIKLAKNKNLELKSKEELITYAQDLWSQGIEQDLFVVLLSQKRAEIEQRSVDVIQTLKNLAKYPPALGMAGTVIGIVSLFRTLGGDKLKIGPALALALTATFFGLAVANAIVMPLADRLQVKHISQRQYLQNVYQLLLLISQDEATHLIEDEVEQRAG